MIERPVKFQYWSMTFALCEDTIYFLIETYEIYSISISIYHTAFESSLFLDDLLIYNDNWKKLFLAFSGHEGVVQSSDMVSREFTVSISNMPLLI